MKRDFTNYTLTMADGQEKNISQCTVKEMLQWLEDLPDWTPDEVEAVMTECCDRLGMDITDYEYCDDCYDKLTEAYHNWETDTDVEKLDAYIDGRKVSVEVTRNVPDDAVPAELDSRSFYGIRNSELLSYFDYYKVDGYKYVAVRREL